MAEENRMRLSRKVALCTDFSRREAAEIIKKGEIMVNGIIEKDPAKELVDQDVVSYANKVLTEKKVWKYYLFNKPKTMLFGAKSDKNRPSVLEIMAKHTQAKLTSIHPVSDGMCGLLILTDDPECIDKFATGIPRVKQLYEIVFSKILTAAQETQLKKCLGVKDDEEGSKIKISREEGKSAVQFEWFDFGSEKIFDCLAQKKLPVEKMDRIYFGGMNKKNITRGWFRPMTEQEKILLKYFYNPPKDKKNQTP